MLAGDTTFAAFLFTDVEGSTALWQAHPQAMHAAMAAHDAIVRAAIARHGGRVVKGTGDGFHIAFDRGVDAVRAMLDTQLALADPAATAGVTLRVRSGVHMGECWARDADYFGPEVNRAARIAGAAHGAQMLVSNAVAHQLEGAALPDGAQLRDLGRVRLRDLERAQHLHQLVHPALRDAFPPLRSLETTPNNLVAQVNALVDRDQAMVQVPALLDAHRLVTLFGPGGIGKTRLSLQVAATMLERFPDGVWFVDLSPLSQPDLLPQALASVLGVREEDGAHVQQALERHVATRELLVILDNCEHVVDACAVFARRLLAAGPKTKILASSREVLRLSGEQVYPVPSLAAPDPDAHDAAGLAQADAVQLFFDRAKAAQPALRVDEASTRAAARICHHLDGLPLAIELAAARVRALSVQAIADRIDDRFRLLGRADRTHLPRQQTLRALVDWSYDLLPASEQRLLQRLSVFAGGFTLEACEAVCAGQGIVAAEVLDLLTALVEKSLVVAEVDSDRFRLLDTVRHYARDRLDEAGGVTDAHDRHRDHYVALAEAARPELAGPRQAQAMARLDAERDNLVDAHAWSLRSGDDGAGALRLSHALRPYWINRGRPMLGLGFTSEALARTDDGRRDFLRCKALYDAGAFLFVMGRYHAAREHMLRSLDDAQALGEVRWAAGVHQVLGMACIGDGDRQAAAVHLSQGLDFARAAGDRRELAAACTTLAQLHRLEGRLDDAESLYRESLDLARALDDRESIAVALLNAVCMEVLRERTVVARANLLEALALEAEVGSMRLTQCVLEVGAALAAAVSDAVRAARLLGAAEAMAATTGMQRDPADDAFLQACMGKARNALGDGAFERHGREGAADAAISPAVDGLRAWLQASAIG